jgi:hypothetical protein
VTRNGHILRAFKLLWVPTWPLWMLVVFASLAVVRLLPEEYARASVAAPVLLMVPGSLSLGAAFSQRRRPQGMAFVCYAALLSTIWSVFTSLALYVLGVLITADSTFWCLFTVSAVLAIVAEARLLLGRPGRGRRAIREPQTLGPDLLGPDVSDAGADEAETPASPRGGHHFVVAGIAGVALLAGGLYTYDHLPHPTPTGYTFMAWTGPPITGDIVVGSAGTHLHFQIAHRQSDTTVFTLKADWLGSPSRPLAKSLTFKIGPNRTFQGTLFIPPLPDGCTYRIVLSLTAIRQIDQFANKPQNWSLNADVHDPGKSQATCKT